MVGPLSFPYPKIGTVIRAAGQGCKSCINSGYCPALYWYKRFSFKDPDEHVGKACLSWSNIPAPPPVPNAGDQDESDYQFNQGIASEPNRNGITDAVSGTSRRP